MDLYIYYRADSANAEKLQARITAIQTDLRREFAVTTALKRRPELQNGKHTWMEIYCTVPNGFDVALAHAVEQTELMTLIDGERHTEIFLDLTTCA